MPIVRIQNRNLLLNIPPRSGIYKVVSLDQNNNPVPIQRLLGPDANGVLFIGSSENLNDGLQMLWRAIQPNYSTTAHPMYKTYKNNPNVIAQFPIQTLAVDYQIVQNHKTSKDNQLNQYRLTFGEVPPLNSSKS
jgi:hypothetical protein